MPDYKTVHIHATREVEVPLTEHVDSEEEIKRMAKVLGTFTSSDLKAGDAGTGKLHEDLVDEIEIVD